MLIVYPAVSVNFLFIFLVQFVRLFVFFLLICKNVLFIKESLHVSVTYCKYFLPICHMPFSYILPPEVLHFYVVQLVNFSPHYVFEISCFAQKTSLQNYTVCNPTLLFLHSLDDAELSFRSIISVYHRFSIWAVDLIPASCPTLALALPHSMISNLVCSNLSIFSLVNQGISTPTGIWQLEGQTVPS